MPKIIPQNELDAVFQAVIHFPEGASIEDIRDDLEIDLTRRTLQRRLALLVEQNRLVIVGRGRGSCYRQPSKNNVGRTLSIKTMKKDDVLAILSRLKPELSRRFGVTHLALFGSTVRDQARPDSDVDIVVAFDRPATSKSYFGVQFLLEDELGRPVDLVTEKAMRPELRPYIDREAINV